MQELKQSTRLQGGKYVIKRVLGQGGFGITYLAEQVSLGREVAIKEFFMKDSCTRDITTCEVLVQTYSSAVQVERYRKKFLKEARIMAGLDHPNILSVIDVWNEHGTVYYSMPYLSGGSIKDLVNQCGHLEESVGLRYASQVADALKYMHQERHICHYDVKPENILLDSKGNAVLIDFGISKNYDSQGNETSTTPIAISEGYAPIEQYQQMVSEFSPASDVYALGATLFFMLMGTKPPSAISLVQGTELSFNIKISQSVQKLIKHAMSVAKKDRPQNVEVFLNLKHDKSPNDDNIVLSSDHPIIKQLIEDMVLVEGGTFTRGGNYIYKRKKLLFFNYDDRVYIKDHCVTVYGFKICRYQVTNELWDAVMRNDFKFDASYSRRPKQGISWNECQRFISKLNEITGMKFRLPTEAEWEFAARGGNKRKHYNEYSGSSSIDDVAWYYENSGGITHNVGSKAPNELGLYDMSGNVFELCQDWYGDYSTGDQTNPKGPFWGEKKVCRGGCYNLSHWHCLVRARHSAPFGDIGYHQLGLRLAL